MDNFSTVVITHWYTIISLNYNTIQFLIDITTLINHFLFNKLYLHGNFTYNLGRDRQKLVFFDNFSHCKQKGISTRAQMTVWKDFDGGINYTQLESIWTRHHFAKEKKGSRPIRFFAINRGRWQTRNSLFWWKLMKITKFRDQESYFVKAVEKIKKVSGNPKLSCLITYHTSIILGQDTLDCRKTSLLIWVHSTIRPKV